MSSTQENSDKLFLMEVFVESLHLDNSSISLDKNLTTNFTDTCVMFRFLQYPPLMICESDFLGSPVSHQDSSYFTFNSGKSCFFSSRSLNEFNAPFNVEVSIVRKLKEGMLPEKLCLGKALINMSSSFTKLLRKETTENSQSEIKKGSFEVFDDNDKPIGMVKAFIRLSCFGKLIITQFSLNKNDTFAFKGTDINQFSNEKVDIVAPETTRPRRPSKDELAIVEPYRRHSIQNQRMWNQEVDPYISKTGYGKMMGYYDPFAEYRMYGPPPHIDNAPPILNTGRRPLNDKLCACPYPVPPSVMSKYQKRVEKNLNLAPGEVGLQDDQVIFQLPLKKPGDPMTERDKQINSSVFYKLTSAEETKDGQQQKNTVHIKSDDLPGITGQGVGPVSGLPMDDRHDVFLLKIGKKCEGDKKRNLELELRTPKMKEPKPPMTDQSTQFEESDLPKSPRASKAKSTKSKGKGKGKGGKGKKKK